MTHIRCFDHVGITVTDLDTAIAFFAMLGLRMEGRGVVEGAFVETVTAIPRARTEIAMLSAPDGETRLELSCFLTPEAAPGSPAAMANELGLRNVAFEVEDLDAAVAEVTREGYDLVGGIGQYEDLWRMAYVRGPDGIIVSLAARVEGPPETGHSARS